MRRTLVNSAVAVSLLLAVGTCVLWARSQRHIDILSWRGPAHALEFWDIDGIVKLVYAPDGTLAGSPRRPQEGLVVGWSSLRNAMPPGLAREDVATLKPN